MGSEFRRPRSQSKGPGYAKTPKIDQLTSLRRSSPRSVASDQAKEKHKLSEAEESILSKGRPLPGYAKTPKIDPVDFAAPVESALGRSKASDQAKETAPIKICEAIRWAKRPPSNVTKDEREAWKELKKNKTIQILQADKGNATVVLDAADYDAKVHELLDDRTSYDRLKKTQPEPRRGSFWMSSEILRKGRKFQTVSTKKFVRRKDQANRTKWRKTFFMAALSCTRRESH